jgi:hypothetical protein
LYIWRFELNIDEFNDVLLVGIIRTLNILKEVKEEGDNLNEINFEEIIELRKRDMLDPSMLECVVESTNTSEGATQ